MIQNKTGILKKFRIEKNAKTFQNFERARFARPENNTLISGRAKRAQKNIYQGVRCKPIPPLKIFEKKNAHKTPPPLNVRHLYRKFVQI